MHYASFVSPEGTPSWGIVEDAKVYDLGPGGLDLAPTLSDAVREGIFGTVSREKFAAAPAVDEADVRFLPPVPKPEKIICIGVNYRSHQEETGKVEQKAPTVFTRFADTQMGHLAPALMPASTTQFDYEGEMALVISRDAWQVPKEEAFGYVAGYGAYNDFSARDWQRNASQWIPGKNFPGTGAFGPYLVPASDIEDLDSMVLQTRVNGEVRQQAALGDLYFSIPELIEYVTGFTKLSAGDVIVTGTPGGVGLFMEPQGLLSEGDVVEVEITGLGVLRNTVQRSE